MKNIKKLVKTVKKLRGPKGCPWDKDQTHKSLRRYLIEETYEAIDAIDRNNSNLLMEELGDILLQIVLHSQIASEKKRFAFEDVAKSINKKMISRHPHVFSNLKVKDTNEVIQNWEKIKKKEKPKDGIFDNIPNCLPALLKGLKVTKKASKEGIEWKDKNKLWSSLNSEIKDFKEAFSQKNLSKQSEKLGDLLLMIVNLARWYKIDPEESLNNSIKEFIKKFNKR